jgi:hypothetical protein
VRFSVWSRSRCCFYGWNVIQRIKHKIKGLSWFYSKKLERITMNYIKQPNWFRSPRLDRNYPLLVQKMPDSDSFEWFR